MTKTDWCKLLLELKTMRSTNKFGTRINYRYNDIQNRIEKVGDDYLLLSLRQYIRHCDVIDVRPSEFKQRFYITLNPFKIKQIL